MFWLSPLVLNFQRSGPQCSVHSCSSSLLDLSLALVYLIHSWLFWAEIKCNDACCALPKHPINQNKPVQKSRQQVLTAYCPKIHTVFIIQLNLMVGCRKKTVIARNCCPIHVCSHFYFDIKFGNSAVHCAPPPPAIKNDPTYF